ncbi:MAG TPA: hypothetical protein VMF30_05045 [Pirellulales bacterium]|nr:hypothetical protein [Pirellulales bacterium]
MSDRPQRGRPGDDREEEDDDDDKASDRVSAVERKLDALLNEVESLRREIRR